MVTRREAIGLALTGCVLFGGCAKRAQPTLNGLERQLFDDETEFARSMENIAKRAGTLESRPITSVMPFSPNITPRWSGNGNFNIYGVEDGYLDTLGTARTDELPYSFSINEMYRVISDPQYRGDGLILNISVTPLEQPTPREGILNDKPQGRQARIGFFYALGGIAGVQGMEYRLSLAPAAPWNSTQGCFFIPTGGYDPEKPDARGVHVCMYIYDPTDPGKPLDLVVDFDKNDKEQNMYYEINPLKK